MRFLAFLLAACLFAQSDFVGVEPAKPSGPAPRTANGKPDLNGYWKGSKNTKPVGNIAKDLPGFELPFTPAGAAAYEYNQTKTVDPEAVCNHRRHPPA